MWDLSKITITPEILSLISELDEFKGTWKLLGILAPDRLQALRKVATIESIGSSTRIEGSRLSDREVEHLLSNINIGSFITFPVLDYPLGGQELEERKPKLSRCAPQMPKSDNVGIKNGNVIISRDEQEVAGYAFVCEEVFQSFEAIAFSENVIKQLHGWLLQYSTKDQRHKGEYKKLSNNVEAFDEDGKSLGIIFETASPFDTPKKMQTLVFWTRAQLEEKTLHPLLIIGIFIVVFLAIHPFQDGNGRLSRILTTLLLLKTGYLYAPYSSLESIIERSKESYYLALRRSQSSLHQEPDFSTWLVFFLRSLQKQKAHLEQKVSREKELNLYMPELASQIINLIHEHGRIGISDIEKMTGENRNTIKKHLANLVGKGTILQLGKGRATWYVMH